MKITRLILFILSALSFVGLGFVLVGCSTTTSTTTTRTDGKQVVVVQTKTVDGMTLSSIAQALVTGFVGANSKP